MSTKLDGPQVAIVYPEVHYDDRFLEYHVGRTLLHESQAAVLELIANAWDAGATDVQITWPERSDGGPFRVLDNGTGMTHGEFDRIWRTLHYNRHAQQGSEVVFPPGAQVGETVRHAYGRSGIGRWAGFCFGNSYTVETRKDGLRNKYQVTKGTRSPFKIVRMVEDDEATGHGTEIRIDAPAALLLSPAAVRNEIGMRFLTNPNFVVSVNSEMVTFDDVREANIDTIEVDIAGKYSITLIVIDTRLTDRTARQHGVAWHVFGRLVGNCSWRVMGSRADDLFIDRRRAAAKRYTFIVRVDNELVAESVLADWSGFDERNASLIEASDAVYTEVEKYIYAVSQAEREETLATAQEHNLDRLRDMSPRERELWKDFVETAQAKCPSVNGLEIVKLSEVLANLEASRSKYALISKLSQYGSDQLDDLHRILGDWTLDMVKDILDEIAQRLKLVDELQVRIRDNGTREVQDLQPLFEKGLWIFGPEFETIEYVANEGMTNLVQKLFKSKSMGSLHRPDFAILPDGTCGLYSLPEYDNQGGECGVDRLVIVELKKPGVSIGEKQKGQTWKYVKELYEKGFLRGGHTRVKCFVLGSQLDSFEDKDREELDRSVVITPMLFETVLSRAKSRLLNLYDRVKNAPHLEAHRAAITKYLQPMETTNLFSDV